MKLREIAEFENESKELKFKERQCNNCLLQKKKKKKKKKNLPHKLESAIHVTGKKKERLQKVAEHKASKHLLESPELREERLQKILNSNVCY